MKLLRTILSKVWRVLNTTRIIILNVIFFILLILFFAVLSGGDDIPQVPEDGLLVLNLKGMLVEEKTYISPFDQFFQEAFGSGPEIPEINVHELVATLNSAIEDERIGGIVLDLRYFMGGGLSKMQVVGERLNAFRETGRPLITFGDYYTQSQYYLASHADTVYLNPMGGVALDGFHYYQLYFKNLLEKLKVNQHIFQVGQYKSAVEPFMRDDMSQQAREANEAWLNELWTQYLNGVQLHRDLPAQLTSGRLDDYMQLFEQAGFDQAQLALQNGLVDKLATREEVRVELINLAGLDADTDSFRQVTLSDYQANLRAAEMPRFGPSDEPAVAVIIGRGAIMDGQRRAGEIGGDTLAKKLRDARMDDTVKAVVLRIDSPGGSAFASEIIRQEVVELREAGKPVIASMSSTAASGGYWIAAGADEIIASPTTITGSIGVFGMFLTFENSLDHVGVNMDGISTTEMPYFNPIHGLEPQAAQLIQRSIEEIYQQFLTLVADARDMSTAEVHEIAQGRVWTGQAALDRGLVDALGEVELAIARAAELAELEADSFEVRWPTTELSPAEQLMADLFGTASALIPQNNASQTSGLAQKALREVWQDVKILDQFNDRHGVYLRCLQCKVDE